MNTQEVQSTEKTRFWRLVQVLKAGEQSNTTHCPLIREREKYAEKERKSLLANVEGVGPYLI